MLKETPYHKTSYKEQIFIIIHNDNQLRLFIDSTFFTISLVLWNYGDFVMIYV